ncbi:NRDE family protein [Penaeicola halotolerans]|uniref:NRDE family protein n=1 Tax=Penaeicola halotolerans TaxID=2793196 RepID=UPI001CF90005|nr:NRDE family protein [Penaeicola halotolerans]
MCLITFAYQVHPDYDLILVGNRDEFFARPTRALHEWKDQPIIAGKDLKAGGTWLGIHPAEGRLAALTNYRDLSASKSQAPSRGELPLDFLKGKKSPSEYVKYLQEKANKYHGFNMLVYAVGQVGYVSNYASKPSILNPGVYGISNALLDTPWPKLKSAKSKLQEAIKVKELEADSLITLLTDDTRVKDPAKLPKTGVPTAVEEALSAEFIRMEGYGTVSSTVVLWGKDGQVTLLERSYAADPNIYQDQKLIFQHSSR